MAKRIILGLVFLTGCAAETADTRQDAPPESEDRAIGAEGPTAAPPRVHSEVDTPILAWSFEPASPDCNGWPVDGAEAIRASPARTGTYSCKVCANGSAPNLKIMRELGAVAAGHYVLRAWVRKRAATAAPDEALGVIEADTASGAVLVATPSVSVREEWDRLEATLDLETDASRVRVTIGAPSADADRCLFIDDVTLTHR